MRHIRIFDTTLRDGEQSPGVALSVPQKLEIAQALARLGVDIIEAGFPITSQGDFDCVQRIAREVRGPVICGLARTHKTDIERAAKALDVAEKWRIHTFTSASKVHLQYMLKKTPEQVLEITDEMVRYARTFCNDVEFSAQDVMRADFEFVIQVFNTAIDAGATTINIPDTTGYGTPVEYGALIKRIYNEVVRGRDVHISTHCHDDLGMATANSLAAVENGATQIECTINGIGERAGNTSLEEVVMALYTRKDHYQAETKLNTRELYRISRMVSRHSGMVVQPNKAIVGDNAFAHESGIHQDGVIKNKETYEIMNAELVGREAGVLVLGKHSGRAAFKKALEDLGYDLKSPVADHGLTEDSVNTLFSRFKEIADRKGAMGTEELRALVETFDGAIVETYKLESIQVLSGTHVVPTATITLQTPQGPQQIASSGDGPVDAAYKAISKLTEVYPTLENYRIEAVTHGGDAVGEVSIRARVGEIVYSGNGVATDIVESSARAWLEVINASIARVGVKKEAISAI
jgi:2-isopropylmalate synthase